MLCPAWRAPIHLSGFSCFSCWFLPQSLFRGYFLTGSPYCVLSQVMSPITGTWPCLWPWIV